MISVAKGATAASTPVLARALAIAALAAIGVGAAEVAMPVAAEDGTSLAAEAPEEITVTARRRGIVSGGGRDMPTLRSAPTD